MREVTGSRWSRRVAVRFAWCGGAALLLLTVWEANTIITVHHHTELQSLTLGKPDDQWPTWATDTGNRTLGTYDDGASSWSVYVRYRGCPVTPRGAFRVTVYQNQYKWNSIGQGSWVGDLSKPAIRYTRTAIDYRRSANVLYTWPAHRESSWEVHVEVPSPKGCTWWKYGSETN